MRRVPPTLGLAMAVCVSVGSGSSRPVAAALTPAREATTRFEFERPQMGTTARVVLYTTDQSRARQLADLAFARIAALDARLSDQRTDSELMALCRRAGGPPVRVSEDLYIVLSAAQRMAERTAGAFDVTIGPLSRIWRRARVTGERPSANSISSAKALVGYRHVELSAGRIVKLAKAGMLLDLGGIAKGYAADQALAMLRDKGAQRALVAIGGDIAAGDPPPDKVGWVIDVAPLGPAARTNVPSVALRRAALSTSGDAEQYVEIDGIRLSHLLTPGTGRPLEGRRGVTIVGPTGMTADALATAVSVLGNTAGLALIEETRGAAAFIIELTPTGQREYRSSRW